MSRRVTWTTAVVFALAGPALAAGPVLAQTRIVEPTGAAVDWTGPYAGLSFGGAWSDGEAELERDFGWIIERDVALGLFPRSVDDRDLAAFGGANAGYNVQRGSFVGGIELDIGVVGESNDIDFSRIDPGGETPFDIFEGVDTRTSYSTDIDALASLKLRGGFADGRNLFYATAGVAAGRVENRFALDVPDFPGGAIEEDWSEDGVRRGYVLGLGAERRLTERLSIKGEVMYYDLEDVTIEARSMGQGLDYEFDNTAYIFKLGVNFRF